MRRYLRAIGFVFGLVVVMGVFLIVATPARAELIGCRDSDGNGVTATGDWAAGGFEICWNVSFNGATSRWNYTYTFDVTRRDVSHVIIELTSGLTDVVVTGGSSSEIGTFSGDDPSNPGMPGPLYGIKVNDGTDEFFTFTLNTPTAPAWGDFYAKDGGNPDTYAYNTGFGSAEPTSNPLTAIETNFIVRPDSRNGNGDTEEVPEPVTALLLFSGLAGVAFTSRLNARRSFA